MFYYIKPFNRFYRFTNRKSRTTILLYCKFPIDIGLNELSNDLFKLIKNKSFTKSYCMDFKKEIKENFILDLHQIRKKSTKKKLAHHPVFDATKYTLENAGKSSELMKFGYLYSEICGYKIRNFESIENAFKLTRVKLDDKFRFHRCFRFFKRNELSSLSEYVIRNGKIKGDNFSIGTLNPYEIQISIHSGKNEELCNLELFNRGIEEIRESLRVIDDISIVDKLLLEGFLRREEFTVELGNKVIYPELEQIKKDFVIGKWYNIYKKLRYQFDKSWGKLELDFRFKIRLNDLVKIIKLIEEFKLYKKGILAIEPFSLENDCLKNIFLLEYKPFNEIHDFNNLEKFFYMHTTLRDSKKLDSEFGVI